MIEWIEKYLKEAETLVYDGNIEQGLELLKRLLYEEPGYGKLHNHLGWAYYYHTGNVEQAETHLLFAIRFDPGYAAPYHHLGNLYLSKGRYDQAIRYLQEGVTKSGGNRVAMYEAMAHSYELKKDYGMAIKTYKEAMVYALGHEMSTFSEGIKRCRKKRWVMMFAF